MCVQLWSLLAATGIVLGSLIEEVPKELLEAFHYRTRAKSSKLTYVVTEERPKLSHVRITNRYSATLCRNRIMVTRNVDDASIRDRDPKTGNPLLGVRGACLPKSIIVDRDSNEEWHQSPGDTGLGLNATGDRPPLMDPRTVGLFASWHSDQTPQSLIEAITSWDARWAASKHGDLVHVTSLVKIPNLDRAAIETSWVLDPSKKNSPIEVSTTEHRPDGSVVMIEKTTTEYALQDGNWWPARSEWNAPLTNAIRIVVFESVEFDRPEHPQRISIDMLGRPVGVEVLKIGVKGKYPSQRLRYVGDGRTVTEEEWEATKGNYDLGPRDAYYQMMEQPINQGHWPAWWNYDSDTYGLNEVKHKPDLWEAYVHRWITKHRPGRQYQPADALDDKQVNAAWAILEDCRKQARPIVERQRADTAKLVADKSLKVQDKPDPRVESIFSELKKRLDGLLREAQIKTPSTQPAPRREPIPTRR